MTTTFRRFADGQTTIKLDGPAMTGLCAGFITTEGPLETRYAFCNGGMMLRADATDMFGQHKEDFDFRGQCWTRVDAIPDDAIFIGCYKRPWTLTE